MCSRWWIHTRTVSPTTTGWAGFTETSLIFTCPARQAAAAWERVLHRRTAHTQASMRTLLGALEVPEALEVAGLANGVRHH